MFPASTNADGHCLAYSDVCATPLNEDDAQERTAGEQAEAAENAQAEAAESGENIPYPNLADNRQGDPYTAALSVRIQNMPMFTAKTEIIMSSGDEPGALGGVASRKIKGQAKYITGSTRVLVEGSPAVYQGANTGQNGAPNLNTASGAQVKPSQHLVMVSP